MGNKSMSKWKVWSTLFALSVVFMCISGCKEDASGSSSTPHDSSKPVEITDFLPKTGGVGQRLVIYGRNFGNDKSIVRVTIGEREAIVIGVNNEGIYCIVPEKAYKGDIKVYVGLDENPKVADYSEVFDYQRKMVVSTLAGYKNDGLTQKQVDAYYMVDGTDTPGKDLEIGRNKDGTERPKSFTTQANVAAGRYKPLPAGVSLQYADREPRFYTSMGYNGSIWNMENSLLPEERNCQVFYYREDGNGYTNTLFWVRTGIGVKKFVHPQDTRQGGNEARIVPKLEPAIRYGDILLMYAEALNELTQTYNIPSWNGTTTYTISRDVNEMKRGI